MSTTVLSLPNTTPLDVRRFRLASDPDDDWIPTINRAIATGVAQGRRRIFLWPRTGDYPVKPSASSWIQLQSGVEFFGDDRNSVLKVADDAGNYPQIISGITATTLLDGVVLRNFRIDQNPDGNTTANVLNADNNRRLQAFLTWNYKNVHVDRVAFDPCVGCNTVVINDETDGEGAWVTDCSFNWQQGATTTPDYDNSAVYVAGKDHYVTGNRFVSTLAERARACIETHVGPSVVKGNIGIWFQTIVNAVSAAGSTPDPASNLLTVTDNVLINGTYGIQLWPLTGHTLRGVVVANNNLHLAQVDWNENSAFGVALNPTTSSQGDLDGFSIHGNLIEFQAGDTRATDRSGNAIGYASTFGIGVSGRGASIGNGSVKGNTVRNSPLYGMVIGRLDAAATNRHHDIAVKLNTFIDCGQNSATLAGVFAEVDIDLRGDLERILVEHNDFLETGATNVGTYNIYSGSVESAVDVVVKNNRARTKSGTARANTFHADIETGFATASLNYGSIAAGAEATLTVAVKGAATGDTVHLGWSAALEDGISVKQAWVSAANTVSIRVRNGTAGAIDPAAVTVSVRVEKQAVR